MLIVVVSQVSENYMMSEPAELPTVWDKVIVTSLLLITECSSWNYKKKEQYLKKSQIKINKNTFMEKCLIACNLCPTCFGYTLVIIEDISSTWSSLLTISEVWNM